MGKWTGRQSEFTLRRGKVYWLATRSVQHFPVGMYAWSRGTSVMLACFSGGIACLYLIFQGLEILVQVGFILSMLLTSFTVLNISSHLSVFLSHPLKRDYLPWGSQKDVKYWIILLVKIVFDSEVDDEVCRTWYKVLIFYCEFSWINFPVDRSSCFSFGYRRRDVCM